MSARLKVPLGLTGSQAALIVAVPAAVALAVLVSGADTLLLLVLTMAALGGVAMLIRPEWATLIVAFLLYSNIPVVASQFHGVPKVFAGAFMLLLAVPLSHHVLIRRQGFRFDKGILLMLIYGAVMCTASFRAQDLTIALARIQTFALEGLVLYWLLLNSIRTFATLRRVVVTLLAAATLLGGLTIFQAVTRNYNQQFLGLAQRQLEFVAKEDRGLPGVGPRMYRSDRAEGPMGDPNRYAQILIVLLPLAYVMTRRRQSATRRLVHLAATGAIAGGVILTYSRGGYLGLVAMALVASQVGWIRPRLLVAGGLALAILAPIVAPSQVKRLLTVTEVVVAISEGPGVQTIDASIRGRLTETLAAANVFIDHPFIGVGPGQYTPFYSERYQQNPSIKFREIKGQRRAHNLYSELAAETGTLGLLSFFAIAFWVMSRLWHERRRWMRVSPEHAELATAFLVALAGYLATAVFLHLSFERYYWLLIGLSAVTVQILGREWRHGRATRPDMVEPVPFDLISVGAVPTAASHPESGRPW